MDNILELFPETYESSRQRFRENLATIQKYWPEAKSSAHYISGDEDLSIDWIYSDGLEQNDKVLIFTTGEHGVECYVGSAMLQRFIDEYLPRLNPKTTGLLLVHTINPWGMKNHRRVNASNIDLNRTFLYDGMFDPHFNPEYDSVDAFLNPKKQVSNLTLDNLRFYAHLISRLIRMGKNALKYTVLLGQYRHPQGLFYGGTGYQEETSTIIDLYRETFNSYNQILHLDMHTGYGPRFQMSLVNSAFDTLSSQEYVRKFNYPLVVAANPEEFYAVQGDMIDFVYTLCQQEFPNKSLYSTSFEFGTLGDTAHQQAGSPRAMVLENQMYFHGAADEKLANRIKHDFEELFNPGASDWRRKAVEDADKAFEGILSGEGYFLEN